MKKIWSKLALVMVILALLGSGCALFRNPLGSWNKAEAKIEAVQKKVDANEDKQVDAAKNYVFATGLALRADPSTNRAHEVATDLNEKAGVVLGPPDMSEVLYLKEMVRNLLETNKVQILKGEEQLAELDGQVVALQKDNAALALKLDKAEQKLVDVGTANAGLAQKWSTLVKIFWWIIYGFIFIVVVKILGAILPPPYNSAFGLIDYVLGGLIRGVFKLAPKAMETAKVVKDDYQKALQHVVTSVQDIKERGQDLEALKTELKVNTNETTKQLITKVKADLGYI